MPAAQRIDVPTAATPPAAQLEDRIGRDDRSALICCHEPTYREYLTGQLRGLGFKVQHALDGQGAIQRLASRSYDVTVILENLEGCTLADNHLWRHFMSLGTDERRATFLIMLCQSFATGDESHAYALSVDQLIAYGDIGQFSELCSAALEEHRDRNRFFDAALRKAA